MKALFQKVRWGRVWFALSLVIMAFCDLASKPELGAQRRRAVGKLPFRCEMLGLPEAGTYWRADWENPSLLRHGLQLDFATPDVITAYERNYRLLDERLRPYLSADTPVFTHNPWGEYGHEDHVQLNIVLRKLAAELGFPLYVSGYCYPHAERLAARFPEVRSRPVMSRSINLSYVRQVKSIYQEHDCWTWEVPDPWGDEDTYLQSASASA